MPSVNDTQHKGKLTTSHAILNVIASGYAAFKLSNTVAEAVRYEIDPTDKSPLGFFDLLGPLMLLWRTYEHKKEFGEHTKEFDTLAKEFAELITASASDSTPDLTKSLEVIKALTQEIDNNKSILSGFKSLKHYESSLSDNFAWFVSGISNFFKKLGEGLGLSFGLQELTRFIISTFDKELADKLGLYSEFDAEELKIIGITCGVLGSFFIANAYLKTHDDREKIYFNQLKIALGFDSEVDNEIVHELFNTTLKRIELLLEYAHNNELQQQLQNNLIEAKEIHEGLPAKVERLKTIRIELSENQKLLSGLIALQEQINVYNQLKNQEQHLEDELRDIMNHETRLDVPMSTVESITTPFLDNEAEKLQAELRSVRNAIDETTDKITTLHREAINPNELEPLSQTIAIKITNLEQAIQEIKNQKIVLSDTMHNEHIKFKALTTLPDTADASSREERLEQLSQHIDTHKASQVKRSAEIIRLAKNTDEIFSTHSILKESLPPAAMTSFQRSKLAAIPERDAVAGESKTADTPPSSPRGSRGFSSP